MLFNTLRKTELAGINPSLGRYKVALLACTLLLMFLVPVVLLTKNRPTSWNDESRVAAIESFVERGTWAIDDSMWQTITKDKVFLNGHFYSDKMPLLSFLGAGVYYVLHAQIGASLAQDCAKAAHVCAYYWITLLLVSLPACVMLLLFLDYARRIGVPLWASAIGTGSLALATMILPYSAVFNHHVPSAVCLFCSFYILATRPLGTATHYASMFLAGVFAGLAPSFDLLSGILAIGLFAFALDRYHLNGLLFVIGLAIPIVLTGWLDYQIGHTFLPPYLVPHSYRFAGSVFSDAPAGLAHPSDYLRYAAQMFLGTHGLFQFNPIIVFSIVALITLASRRHDPLWSQSVVVLASIVLFFVYIAIATNDYGGNEYGERYFIPALPILFSFTFFLPPLDGKIRFSPPSVIFALLLTISLFSSLQGAFNPWVYTPPPFFELLSYR